MGAVIVTGLAKALPYLLRLLPYFAVAGMVWWGMNLKSNLAEAEAEAWQAQQVAAANAQAVKEIQWAKEQQDWVVAQMQRDADTRGRTYQQTRKEILIAPNSQACSVSGPIRALIAGLRVQAPAGADAGSTHQDAPGTPGVQGRSDAVKRNPKR